MMKQNLLVFLLVALFTKTAFAHGALPQQYQKLADEYLAEFDSELVRATAEDWDLFRSPAYQKLNGIRLMHAAEELPAEADSSLMGKIEDRGRVWATEAMAASSRAPKIYPSTGAPGNINGASFPVRTWAMTLDDGPHRLYTQSALSALTGIHATFFWLARNVLNYPAIVDLVKNAGMSLANHSYTHPQIPKISSLQMDKEIFDSTAVQKKAYGYRPAFFRLPYGSGVGSQSVRAKIAAAKMVHVMWNVDSLDWKDKSPQSVHARVARQMQLAGQGIILFHDIQAHTPDALSLVLKNQPRGLRWVSIPEIVSEINAGP